MRNYSPVVKRICSRTLHTTENLHSSQALRAPQSIYAYITGGDPEE